MTPVGAQSIWKASTRLADGREIVYFDEAPGLDRVLARDTRPLPPRSPGSFGPSVERSIGMGYVASPQTAVGTALTVEIRGALHAARVVKTPFHPSHTKKA